MATRDHGRMSRSRLYVTVVCHGRMLRTGILMTRLRLFNKRGSVRKLDLLRLAQCTYSHTGTTLLVPHAHAYPRVASFTGNQL